MDLTKSEENILEILLDSDTPLSKSGILEHAPKDKCWKDGSIHILLCIFCVKILTKCWN